MIAQLEDIPADLVEHGSSCITFKSSKIESPLNQVAGVDRQHLVPVSVLQRLDLCRGSRHAAHGAFHFQRLAVDIHIKAVLLTLQMGVDIIHMKNVERHALCGGRT